MTDREFWDRMYGSSDRLFSGAPNAVLVAEMADQPPGHALDIGCGEGADALWLAQRGWRVTAVDISPVALERAAALAASSARPDAPPVCWTQANVTVTPPTAGAYDLVSAQYFPLYRRRDRDGIDGLIAAVAPGGTLLVVGHDLADLSPDGEHGFFPGDYYQPHEIVALLGDDWTVQVDQTRPRTTPGPPGTHHTHDTVLRARRED